MIALWLACAPPGPTPREPGPVHVARADRVRFVALGDTGKGDATQRAVAAGIRAVCASRGCDFALLLGDNLYPRGMDRRDDPRMDAVFTAVYGDLGLDFHAVLGNHDYGMPPSDLRAGYQLDWASRQPRFHLPALHYRFDAGPAAFWALDTDRVFWNGPSPQAEWLDETLAPSDAPWRVVFGHHPWRSDGEHGNAGAYTGWSNLPYASGRALRDLYEGHVAGRADLVLAGHDHNLQLIEHAGSALVVSGAGASTTPIVDRGNQPLLAFAVPGFAWVELGDEMTIALHGADGALLDERTLPRQLRNAPQEGR